MATSRFSLLLSPIIAHSRCSSGFDLSFLDPKAPPDVATVPKDAEILPSATAKNREKQEKKNGNFI